MIVKFDVFKGNNKMNDIFDSLKLNVEYSVGCSKLFAFIKESYDNETDYFTLQPVHYIVAGSIQFQDMTFSVEIANILNESGFFSQYIISQDCTYVRDGKVQQDGNYTLRDTEEGVIERMVNLDQVLKLSKGTLENSANKSDRIVFFRSRKSGAQFISEEDFLKNQKSDS